MNHLVNISKSNNQEEQKNVEDDEDKVIIIFVLLISYLQFLIVLFISKVEYLSVSNTINNLLSVELLSTIKLVD